MGVARAWAEIESADAVLFLHDLGRHSIDADTQGAIKYRADDARIQDELAQKLPQKIPVIEVWNKSDLVPETVLRDLPAGILISAKTGLGLQHLREQLLTLVGWQGAPEGVFMARERHVRALGRVQAQLLAAQDQLAAARPALDLLAEDLRQAQLHLSEITGVFTADDLLGEIFSSFCIGK